MYHAHIPGFPNRIPKIDWLTYLPRFKDKKGEYVGIHLFRFHKHIHKHIHKLGIELHEDYLVKIFMASLEENARSWYEGLPS